jgi:hypothetical protein
VIVALGCVEKLPSTSTVELSDEPRVAVSRRVGSRPRRSRCSCWCTSRATPAATSGSGGGAADDGTLAIIIGASVGALLCIIALVVGLVCLVRQQSARGDAVEAGSVAAPQQAAAPDERR